MELLEIYVQQEPTVNQDQSQSQNALQAHTVLPQVSSYFNEILVTQIRKSLLT